jgi:type IV pilus assembly protein PilX
VLFVALIVMVVMTLAAIALFRSAETTNQAMGNLALRQASIAPANLAVEAAAASLFPDANNGGPMIADRNRDEPAQNYRSSYRRQRDRLGVPAPLQSESSARALAVQLRDDANHEVTYLIERMCDDDSAAKPGDGAPGATWCEMVPAGAAAGGAAVGSPSTAPSTPFYRVTVRVDGPKKTMTFLQTALRVVDMPPRGPSTARVTWRLLGR